MVIFNSYVKLPEGIWFRDIHWTFMRYSWNKKNNLFCDQDSITKAKQLIIRKFNSNTLKTIKRIKASGLAAGSPVAWVTEIWWFGITACPCLVVQAVPILKNHGVRQWEEWSDYSQHIWVNYNNSLIWIKAIWGWFPLLAMIPMRSQWGRYNLPRTYGKIEHVPNHQRDHDLIGD